MTIINNLTQSLLPLIALVGLIVLVALGNVSANVGVPIIAGIAGVHLGAAIGSGTTTTPPGTTTTSTTQTPPIA